MDLKDLVTQAAQSLQTEKSSKAYSVVLGLSRTIAILAHMMQALVSWHGDSTQLRNPALLGVIPGVILTICFAQAEKHGSQGPTTLSLN